MQCHAAAGRPPADSDVAGIDGYGKGAWVAVLLRGGAYEAALAGSSLQRLLDALGNLDVIAIDIPIGLPVHGVRLCDLEARRRVGRRWRSVFLTPARDILSAPDHQTANEIAREMGDPGVSRQALGIRDRIFEAAACIAAGARLFEVHPELSFATMSGRPLNWSKVSYRGAIERRKRRGHGVGRRVPERPRDCGRRHAMSVQDGVDVVHEADVPRLVEVWEASVRATHDFLSEADIVGYRPVVRDQLFGSMELFCVRDEDGVLTAFSGVKGAKLEALFVHPAWRGAGIGRRLVRHAVDQRGVTIVDVNEQNPQAVGSYRRLGFEVEGRSELDEQGNPFPLLHMRVAS